MRYEALTFDLDGTLVDTAGEIALAINRTLDALGLPAQAEADVARHVGAGLHATLAGVLRDLGAAGRDGPAARAELEAHYTQLAGRTARPYAGSADMLAALRAAGLRLACVTNKAEHFARRVLEGTGLSPQLDLLIGGDTLPYKKPDARVLAHALQALGAAPARSAHVGDSATDVAAARASGVAAWVVPWGYRSGLTVAQLEADRVFTRFADLTAHALARRC